MRSRKSTRQARNVFGLLLAAASLAGCGGSSMDPGMDPNPNPGPPSGTGNTVPPAVMQAQSDNAAVSPAIVTADNGFGLSLFQSLTSGAAGNVAIAPISVAMALQILYNGAAGTTQQAMAQTLQLGSLSTADLNNANAALQASLINPDPKVQLTIANSLWLHLGQTAVLPSFTQMDQNFYGATVGDLAGAPADANAWVSSETDGVITQILPNADYASVTAVIANVIYFKGQWTTAFDPNQTAPAPFTLADGTQVSAQMMHQTGSYGYLQGADFQAVRLPYGQGRMSMLVVLPNSGAGWSSFAADITPSMLDGWVGQLQTMFGNVNMPRFTSTYGVSLVQPLSSLGMGAAFCAGGMADFSALAQQPTCVSDVEHKTVVEVDESGTVAAGATGITIVTTALPAPQFTITMDRPFFYAIRDDQTGELLFVGALLNPAT